MKVAWVHWLDASHGLNEWDKERMGLSDLEEVGFVLKEDADSITLGMERICNDPEAKEARLWLTIPRSGIVEMRECELSKAFPQARKRKGK